MVDTSIDLIDQILKFQKENILFSKKDENKLHFHLRKLIKDVIKTTVVKK